MPETWSVGLIGHGNLVHETSNRERLERFTTFLSKPDLDRFLNKALQAPSIGGGCVIPITVPYFNVLNATEICSSNASNKNFHSNCKFTFTYKCRKIRNKSRGLYFFPAIFSAAYNRERLILYRFGNLVRPIIGSGL